MSTVTKLGTAALCAGLLWGANVARGDDPRADAIARGNEALEAEAKRYNKDGKFKLKLSMDWSSVKDLGSNPAGKARSVAESCGSLMEGVAHLCDAEGTYDVVEPCAAYVNETAPTGTCILEAGESKLELKGKTLVYHMGASTMNRHKALEALNPLFPKKRAMQQAHDADAYLAKMPEAKHTKLVVDLPSFTAAGKNLDGPSGVLTLCSSAYGFVDMVNNPECELQSCKGDGAKKAKLLDGAKQVRCIFSATPKAAERAGDTLDFYVGDWALGGKFDSLGFTVFNELRKKLKLRDCGVDTRSTDPRIQGGVMSRAARQECCAKDAGGKCVSHQYETKYEQVCTVAGLSGEKACHERQVLKAPLRATAR